jgi:tetratricopeptide (TPR) repeat protein
MSDCFEEIHHLLREQQDESVLEKVLDRSRMTINPPYDCDLNHAWYIVGDIYFSAKKYKLSVQAFENSIIDSDEDTDAHLALANSHSKLGHHERARDVLLSALTKKSYDARLRFNLGNAFFDLGDITNAIANYLSITH